MDALAIPTTRLAPPRRINLHFLVPSFLFAIFSARACKLPTARCAGLAACPGRPHRWTSAGLQETRTTERAQSRRCAAGDFSSVLFSVAEARATVLPGASTLTIGDVNAALDRIHDAPDVAEKRSRLLELARRASATEQKWIAKIILKDLKLGFGCDAGGHRESGREIAVARKLPEKFLTPRPGKTSPGSTEASPMFRAVARKLQGVAGFRPNLGPVCFFGAAFGPNLAPSLANFGHSRPEFGPIRPMLIGLGPIEQQQQR